VSSGIPGKKIVSVGWTTSEKVFEKILSVTEKTSTIVAVGNMGGMGADLVDYFENRSTINHD
jgi:tartrate dehydratase beta subunit/fumarate hydratase class I family protein